MVNLNIGIISDGSSDFDVFCKLVQTLLPSDHLLNNVRLRRQCLRNHIDDYWRSSSPDRGRLFAKSVTNALFGAFSDFCCEVGSISSKDIILLTSDAERILGTNDKYFDDWSIQIRNLLNLSIEKFYHAKVIEGYSHSTLPSIFPIILFPSTEILIASVRDDISFSACKALRANQLKQMLYGTDNLSNLSESQFNSFAIEHLSCRKIDNIFSSVAELRLLIKAFRSN